MSKPSNSKKEATAGIRKLLGHYPGRTLQRIGAAIAGLWIGSLAIGIAWEEPDQVKEAANASEKATAALFTAAKSGDRSATMKAFRGVGESCKGCHERYKAEDNHEH